MEKYLKNKSIAVVGNAASLQQRKYGSEIDSHDTVIRFNHASALYYPGEYTCSSGDKTTIWVINNFKWFGSAWERHHKVVDLVVQVNEFDCPDSIYKYYGNVEKLISSFYGMRPSSGMRILDMLCNTETGKITVYGFDWKKTPTFSDKSKKTRNLGPEPHDFEVEEKYFFETILKNKKIEYKG